MKTIAFETPRWGHALHGWTYEAVEDPPEDLRPYGPLPEDWRVFSVVVHSSKYPRKGDLVRYRAENGTATARIVGVDAFVDPPDMFTLFLSRSRPFDLRYNVLEEEASVS